MGQGFSLTSLSAGSASIDVPELADLVYDSNLGTARFMKSMRARNQQGLVCVKAFVKPYPSFGLARFAEAMIKEKAVLSEIANALPHQRILETANGGFLVRQYMNSSLYDRISTRPFLEDIEKKWLAFQLLCAIRDCHANDLFHGDIKSENVLVTSWNWLYLTDFSASYRPTHLPEDNPADFSFYFDTSGRRTCYLAPERFIASGESPGESGLNWAMDIFSAGCVIAELFLEGPAFTLSQIFRYKKGDLSLEHTHLAKIKNDEVRELILHMVGLDPESRYSAEELLTFWRGKVFPEYFYGFLHQYMALLTDFSSGRQVVSLQDNAREADERIERIYTDYDKIAFFLGYSSQQGSGTLAGALAKRFLPLHFDIDRLAYETAPRPFDVDKGGLIFLGVVMSSMRNSLQANARVKACDLLLAFAERLPDEIKLDRIIPYTVALLVDEFDLVRVTALTSMTKVLTSIHVVSPVNAFIFPEYIFPKLKEFITSGEFQPSSIVRAAYASCIGSLAQSSTRILDLMQALKAERGQQELVENDWTLEATFHGLFDVARADLVAYFEEATKSLITDPDPAVRRALLGSVSGLCVFFGSTKSSDVILSHLNTYLNDNDWILKCSFIKVLVGVATFVGAVNLEKFILPLMIQSLTDSESFVVERVIRSLASMAELGLFQKSTLWAVLCIVVRFSVHPSLWIRQAAAKYISACCQQVSVADRYCIVLPLLQPFLRIPTLEVTEYELLDSLKKPLTRPILEMALVWATKVEKGLFWKNATRDAVFVSPESGSNNKTIPSGRQFLLRIPSSQRNDEDEQWLAKLKGLGMQSEDELKLLALREYIWRVAHRKTEVETTDVLSGLNTIVSLAQINAAVQTVFFDSNEPIRVVEDTSDSHPQRTEQSGRIHTIADALLDASTTLNPSPTKRDTMSKAGENPSKPRPIPMPKDTRSAMNGETGQAGKGQTILSNCDPEPSKLLNRDAASKAGAATSTSSENAFAKLDGAQQPRQPSPLSLPPTTTSPQPLNPKSSRKQAHVFYEPNHSYAGQDKNVLRLLNNHFIDTYPTDFFDFGRIKAMPDPTAPIPRVTDPSPTSNNTTSQKPSDKPPTRPSHPWHPTGHLLAVFSEHTGPVTTVLPAPDDSFFVTGSDDGTCRIWDTSRLERNVTPRSRQTWKHPAQARIKAMCFVEKTHALVVAADDGSLHVLKIDYKRTESGEGSRYGKIQVLRTWTVPTRMPESVTTTGTTAADETARDSPSWPTAHALLLQHYRSTSSQSTLLILTNTSSLIALDLKTMTLQYTLSNPLSHGTASAFVIDRKHNWLILGTTHGILDLWDLRFRLRIRSWGIRGAPRVGRLALHPARGKGKWVLVAAGRRVMVWDVEKVVCKEVYAVETERGREGDGLGEVPPTPSRAAQIGSTKPYEPWWPDEDGLEALEEQIRAGSKADRDDPSGVSGARAIDAMWVGFDDVYGAMASEPTKAPFLLTGGADQMLRFWDLAHPESSSVVSGLKVETDGVSLEKVRYEVTHPGGQVLLATERKGEGDNGSGGTARADNAGRRGRRGSTSAKGAGTPADKVVNKPTRSTVISKQQQLLLRNHLDAITDCCVLTKPYGVVVSVDRSGGVYVYQ